METVETKAFALVATTYERSGASETYQQAVETALDVLENALCGDGWRVIDDAWSPGARAFRRSTAEGGAERVSFAIMP